MSVGIYSITIVNCRFHDVITIFCRFLLLSTCVHCVGFLMLLPSVFSFCCHYHCLKVGFMMLSHSVVGYYCVYCRSLWFLTFVVGFWHYHRPLSDFCCFYQESFVEYCWLYKSSVGFLLLSPVNVRFFMLSKCLVGFLLFFMPSVVGFCHHHLMSGYFDVITVGCRVFWHHTLQSWPCLSQMRQHFRLRTEILHS